MKLLGKWTDVKGFEEYLQANKKGIIRSKNKTVVYYPYGKKRVQTYTGRVLNQTPDNRGYPRVWFTYNKKNQTQKVHRLIAKTFIPNEENKSQVNHKDGNKLNNSVENLEWVTNEENHLHAKLNGLTNQPKIKWEDNYKIQNLYKSGNYTQKQISEMYGCTPSNISVIVNKKLPIRNEVLKNE